MTHRKGRRGPTTLPNLIDRLIGAIGAVGTLVVAALVTIGVACVVYGILVWLGLL